jgi:hypothetical protein
MHVWPAPQALPQVPQFVFVETSVHTAGEPQAICPPGQVQALPAHAWPRPQAMLQAPQ